MTYYEYMKNIIILNNKIKNKDYLEKKIESIFKRVAEAFNLSKLVYSLGLVAWLDISLA